MGRLTWFESDYLSKQVQAVDRIRKLTRDLRRAPSLRGFQDRTVAELLSVVALPSTPMIAFLTACRVIKVAKRGDAILMLLQSGLDELVDAFDRHVSHAGLRQIVESGQSVGATMPSTRDLAVRWRTTGRDVSRIISAELGVGVSGLRIALRCRPAIVLVLTTEERISQIAYSSGYEHVSQLDPDCDRLLGDTLLSLRRRFRLSSDENIWTKTPVLSLQIEGRF